MLPAPPPVSDLESATSEEPAPSVHTYDAFKYHWYVWQCCGLKFPDNRKWRLPYIVYAVILNLTVTLAFPLTLVVNCCLSESFTELCENLYITITDVICNFKFLNVFIVRSKLEVVGKILDKLDSRAKTEDEIEVLRMGMRSAYRCFFIFAGMFGCAIVTSQLVVYTAEDRILMYPAWFPLDWKNSYMNFVIVHSYQVYGLTIQAIQNLGNDTYPQAYLRILCAHIEALSRRITKLGTKNKVDSNRNYMELVECIKDHQIIIELRLVFHCLRDDVWENHEGTFYTSRQTKLKETIQRIMSTACLAQFVCTGLAQCTIGVYMLYVGLDYSKLLNIIIFFSAVTLEILILCHFGDQLCFENDRLMTAIYSCNWMDQSRQFKKALLLLLRRSQRPFVMKAGNLIPVRLPTFVQVMKTAYSTFAVLSEIK